MVTGLKVVSVIIFTVVCLARAKVLQGTDKRCQEEGEIVSIPGITNDPCISCICRNGFVDCERNTCGSMDGCYAVLHDKPPTSCCDVCKGCSVNGTNYASGATWKDLANPCVFFQCEAGVVTKSLEKCHVGCDHPKHFPGECCPSCSECFFDGVDRLDGETFQPSSRPDVSCTCKAGRVNCSYRACPVLNCPDDAIYKPKADRCPRCKGQRRIFSLPTACFFAKRVFTQGTILKPDNCTSCTCWGGTLHCERETCPPALCDVKYQVYQKGSCCLKCKQQPSCFHNNKTYQVGHEWVNRETCEQCRCDIHGVLYCTRQACPLQTKACPQGHSLKYPPGACCPRCEKDDPVCTTTSNSYHSTFDDREFSAHGNCRYTLAKDCKNKTFSIKIRNSPHSKEEFWTELVTVRIGNYTINLYRSLKVKVNRRGVALPYVIPSQFTVHRIGNNVIVNAVDEIGLRVIWDGHNRLEVTVSQAFNDHLCGLCGNNNGDPTDDFRDKRGALLSNPDQFLEAWQVLGVCHRPRGHVARDLIAACRPGSAGAIRAEKYCGSFFHNEFSACSSRINIVPYISFCLMDTCSCQSGNSCHLRSIRSLTRRCQRAGFNVKWWRVVR